MVTYYTCEAEPAKVDQESEAMPRTGKSVVGEFREEPMKAKPVSASRSEMAEVVLPAQTNALGKLLGGHVMHLVDIVAAMAASRHANSYMVTASVDYIDFRNAVNLGEIVILKSQVNRVFHTSLEIGVDVYSEDILTGERKHTTSAFVTFVAIDEHTKKPKLVPPLIVKTAEEKRRWKEAAKRREARLALRSKEKK
jgi:acyl-CoA hydrolase